MGDVIPVPYAGAGFSRPAVASAFRRKVAGLVLPAEAGSHAPTPITGRLKPAFTNALSGNASVRRLEPAVR